MRKLLERIFNPIYNRHRRAFVIVACVVVASFLVFVVTVGSTLPDFSVLENTQTNLSTIIFSRDGQVLGQYFAGENRVAAQLHEIPQNLKNALIATEDIRFYNHAGIDLRSQLRAAATLMSGGGMQGGSTLSMQLARNLYDEQVGNARNVFRKIKEIVAATFLERSYTKDEILMHYLNTVPFGGTRYGVQSAARFFFGKNCQDLDLHESAMLVGLLKGPTEYDPHRHPDRARNRRNTVIDQMLRYGVLSESQADSAKAKPLGVVQKVEHEHVEGLAPYFREELREWLKAWCEENGHDLYRDGLRVYTTIDSRMQKYGEDAMRKHLKEHQKVFDQQTHGMNYRAWERDTTILRRAMRQSARYNTMLGSGHSRQEIEQAFREPTPMTVFNWNAPDQRIDTVMSPWDSLRHYAQFLEGGMVTIEPNTGHVLAWVGGSDFRFFKYDHVNKGRRQVGSTFKPFVYTAAFDNGYSPCYMLPNTPFTYITEDGQRWMPRNADGRSGGCLTLRQALAGSVNLITARLMEKVGPRTVADYAYKMGIKSQLEIVPSLSLGTTDLNVMELTSAYSTFANLGRWVEPIFVTRIEDRNGNVLQTFVPNSRRALSPETAYLMIDILRAVVNGGTAAALRYTYGFDQSIDIGGKTGTTQNNSDGWFVAFTPRFCTGVWVGHADRNIHFLSTLFGQGAAMAMPIWGHYMKAVYADRDLAVRSTSFEKPGEMRVETNCSIFNRTHGTSGCNEVAATATDLNADINALETMNDTAESDAPAAPTPPPVQNGNRPR